jgi:signal recognition particle subunit SRP54
VAGLQGAGKTTSVAKLARHLIEREKKSVSVVSADVYRPAAITQLETLAAEVGARFEPSDPAEKPVDIVRRALANARVAFSDVLLIDTAGRLAVDEVMMAEIAALHEEVKPIETLFVVDAMTGQDAATTAKAFGKTLPLTGVILTKVDADTRGGAALSVRTITQRPIKFLGVGEKTDALDPFHPDRLASRILGMGDMLSLIEDVERKVDHEKAKKLATKVQKGGRFDLEDFREQLQQMKNLGGMGAMLDKMPGMSGMTQAAQNVDTKQFDRMEAMIDSMTPKERRNPDLISGSRKRRITLGSGTAVQDLNRLLKQHKQMQKMMKKMKGGGMQRMMRGLGGMTGGPGGGPPPGFPRR